MCGIVCLAGPVVNHSDVVMKATKALIHRGPDNLQVEKLEKCHLGHTRLSIVDLGTGTQPMTDSTGRFTIVFNGEIYNYQELRYELMRKGLVFRTLSDTEAILNGFSFWNENVLDHLVGQFAFVIWDRIEQRIFAARDRMGEKPFFYTLLDDGSIVIASEIKAILATDLIKPKINRLSLGVFWAMEYLPPAFSIYENVKSLPSGCFIRFSVPTGNLELNKYWSPSFSTNTGVKLNDAVYELQRLTQQAIKRQLVADVEVGAFLSGGLDSSTIVALASAGKTLKTFSVGFDFINELPYAKAVSLRYNTDHLEIEIGGDSIYLLDKMAEIFDEPFADSSNIPTYLISKFARQHVKTVLSGDGGDELFGGYNHYYDILYGNSASSNDFKAIELYSKFLRFGKRLGLFGDMARVYSRKRKSILLSKRFPDPFIQGILLRSNIDLDKNEDIFGNSVMDLFESLEAIYRPQSHIEGLDRLIYLDINAYLPGDILRKVDTVTMANGLESRAPFLDHELVEFVLSLPLALRLNSKHQKYLMKVAFNKLWPKKIMNRKKQGFGVPIGNWVDMPEFQKKLENATSTKSLLYEFVKDKSSLKALGKRELWKLVCLDLWFEKRREWIGVVD